MKPLGLWLLPIIFLCLLSTGFAGEIIRFETGSAPPRADVALANVPVKALVTEFLDPGDTGVGKSVGYLVWRELLTAISDQAGAGVILARAPGERRLTDLLETAYHDAAVRIAREQNTRMAVWGAVMASGDDLYISTYLSMLPVEFTLQLSGEPSMRGLKAEISRTKFNFPPVETTRAQLFQRRVVTRVPATVYASADGSAAAVARVPKGKALDAIDMDKGWFKVRLANGRFGYLDNSIVDVPPRMVEATGVATVLSHGPGGPRLNSVTLNGSYRVLDMRYIQTKGLWYELEVNDASGWVPATVVRPRFSLPMVHFVAGLYRYQFKRYDDARREFLQYVNAPDFAADNPSLATAYQLLGVSTLLTQGSSAALGLFTKAVHTTPYDPNAHSLRALSTLPKGANTALTDLEQALRLDPSNATAARITGAIFQHRGWMSRWMTPSGDLDMRERLRKMMNQYPAVREAIQ